MRIQLTSLGQKPSCGDPLDVTMGFWVKKIITVAKPVLPNPGTCCCCCCCLFLGLFRKFIPKWPEFTSGYHGFQYGE